MPFPETPRARRFGGLDGGENGAPGGWFSLSLSSDSKEPKSFLVRLEGPVRGFGRNVFLADVMTLRSCCCCFLVGGLDDVLKGIFFAGVLETSGFEADDVLFFSDDDDNAGCGFFFGLTNSSF